MHVVSFPFIYAGLLIKLIFWLPSFFIGSAWEGIKSGIRTETFLD